MTREIAIKEFYEILEIGVVNYEEKGLISRIYDDFESRICKNCVFRAELLSVDGLVCGNLDNQSVKFITYDFGCNQFTRNTDA